MKHLLKHLEQQVEDKLADLRTGFSESNPQLEVIYQDLLNKIQQALEETETGRPHQARGGNIGGGFPGGTSIEDTWEDYRRQAESSFESLADDLRDAFQSTETFSEFARNFKDLTGKEISEQWDIAQSILGRNDQNETHQGGTFSEPEETYPSEQGAPFGPQPDPEFGTYPDAEKDAVRDGIDGGWGSETDPFSDQENGRPPHERHATQDGSKENFEDLRENLESIGVDVESLGNTANVEDLSEKEIAERALEEALENVDSIEDVDAGLFRSLAQLAEAKQQAQDVQDRTDDRLVEWAVGNRNIDPAGDTEEVANKVQSIFKEARERGVETIDMIRTLDQEIDEFSINIENEPKVETEIKEAQNE